VYNSGDGAGSARSKLVVFAVRAVCLRHGVALLVAGELRAHRGGEVDSAIVGHLEQQHRHIGHLGSDVPAAFLHAPQRRSRVRA